MPVNGTPMRAKCLVKVTTVVRRLTSDAWGECRRGGLHLWSIYTFRDRLLISAKCPFAEDLLVAADS